MIDTRDPLTLAEVHLDALYERSPDGRIRRSRDRAVVPPPVHFVRTPAGNSWAIGQIPAADFAAVEAFLRRRPVVADPMLLESAPPSLEGAPAADDGKPLLTRIPYRGPAFVLPDRLAPPEGAETLTAIEDLPRALSGPLAWICDLDESALPVTVVRDGERIVSVCHSARLTVRAAEAGVETDENARGRGFGTIAVAAWVAAVQESGRMALYSTTWANGPSRRIAARLGFQCYGEDVHIA